MMLLKVNITAPMASDANLVCDYKLQGVSTNITSVSSVRQQEVDFIFLNTQTELELPSKCSLKSSASDKSSLSAPLVNTVACDNVLKDLN